MIYYLYTLALVFGPFTSIPGLSFLGELQHTLSAYIYLVIFGLSLFSVISHFKATQGAVVEKVYGLPVIAMLFFGVIGLSFVANFSTIKDSMLFGRSGLDKFISSTILVLYGFLISYVTYFLAARHSWDRLIIKPLTISVIICAVFSVFELSARLNGGMAAVFAVISAPVYAGFDALEWDTRLRSVAFEPPDFANTAGYIWPWVLGAVMFSKGLKRLGLGCVWMALNVMIVLSEARTSLVMMGGLLIVFAVLWFVVLPKQEKRDPESMIMPITLFIALVVPSALALFILHFDTLVLAVVSGDNVSNLSRLASITAAFRMFADNPFFGLGFGQFGFHVTNYMPNWGFYSPEIKAWLFGAGGFWPAVYSVYARFGADMGVLGLAMWVGVWLWLARAILVETMRYRRRTGELPFAAIPLILSCFGVLLAGIPNDSVRSPMIWVNMGLACRYLVTLRDLKKTAMEKEASS